MTDLECKIELEKLLPIKMEVKQSLMEHININGIDINISSHISSSIKYYLDACSSLGYKVDEYTVLKLRELCSLLDSTINDILLDKTEFKRMFLNHGTSELKHLQAE